MDKNNGNQPNVHKMLPGLRFLGRNFVRKKIILRFSPHFLQKFTVSTFAANYCKKFSESSECGEKEIRRNSPHFLQKFTEKSTAFLIKIHCI